MISVDNVVSLNDFKTYARYFLAERTLPSDINWGESERMIFDEHLPLKSIHSTVESTVPKDFGAMAQTLAMHRSNEKWSLLYQYSVTNPSGFFGEES